VYHPEIVRVALFLFLGATVTASQVARTPAASVEGVLVDAVSGAPVAGAAVRLSCRPRGAAPFNAVADTDAKGRFLFVLVPACSATLSASQPGYLDSQLGQRRAGLGLGRPVSISTGQRLRGLTFPIAPGGVIAGQVLRPSGAAVVAADVEALRFSEGDGVTDIRLAARAQTDDQGQFRLFGLPPGEFVVRAATRSGPPSSSNPSSTSSSCELLTRDNRGTSIYYPGTPSIGMALRVQLDVSQHQSSITIPFEPGAPIGLSGRAVVGPAALTELQAVLIDRGVCVAVTPVDQRGAFSFGPVPPGHYQVDVRGYGPRVLDTTAYGNAAARRSGPVFWAVVDTVVAPGSADVTVRPVLHRGVRVAGRMVTDTGGWTRQPTGPDSRGPTLTLEGRIAAGAPSVEIRTAVRDDSTFEFPSVPPGRYTVRALAGRSYGGLVSASSAGTDALDSWLDVPAGGIPDLVLSFSASTTVIDGQMIAAVSAPGASAPVCYAVVYARDSAYWTRSSRRVAVALPDDAGVFNFRGLPAGDYHLSAFNGEGPAAWSDRDFLASLTASVQVTLVRGQRHPVSLTCR
jgi:hypothetical protein